MIGADNLIIRDYLFGVLSFVIIAVGGIAVGLIFALVSAFLTKLAQPSHMPSAA